MIGKKRRSIGGRVCLSLVFGAYGQSGDFDLEDRDVVECRNNSQLGRGLAGEEAKNLV